MGDLDRAESTPMNRPDAHQNAAEHRPGGKPTAPVVDDTAVLDDTPVVDDTPTDELAVDEVEVGIGQEPNTPDEQRSTQIQDKAGSARESAHRHDDKT